MPENEEPSLFKPCPKSKDAKHEDDGGMFFYQCRHCGANDSESIGDMEPYPRLNERG